MLLEVTALVGAGVDAKEIEAKVARALGMADDGGALETVGDVMRRPDAADTHDLALGDIPLGGGHRGAQ